MKKILAISLVALLCLGATINPDQYDVLFLKCNGTTTTFVDSSTANPKTITANGNATQLPIKFNKSAGFFNGTTDYVVVPDSSDWDFGTGDFNIELFFNTPSVAADLVFVDRSDFKFFWDQSEGKYGCTLEGTAHLSSASTPTVNTWTHVRVKRTSGTLAFYVNGVATGTADASANDVAGTSAVYIGATTTPNTFYSGWMKELRIIKGTSTAVTVPTSEYTASSEANTVLLMHFDTPATSPLGPAVAFDGTGDYLSLADSTDWNFGSGDWSVEFFFKTQNASGTMNLFNQVNSGPYAPIMIQIYSNVLQVHIGANAGAWLLNFAGGTTVVNNVTYHVALVRNGSNFNLYLNGRLDGTASSASAIYDSSDALIIGQGYGGTGFTGSMREIRISNVARYTAPFTPSQTGFTVDANTKLYIKGNEDNGVTTFVDSETTPKTVTTAGDTKIKYTEDYRSCIFKDETGKFPYPVGSAKVDFFAIGSGVGYFGGTNDGYISTPDSSDFYMDGDFTWETYFRCSRTIAGDNIFFFGQSQNATNGQCLFWENAQGKFAFRVYDAGSFTVQVLGEATPLINTWYHLSATRSGNNWNIWLNGQGFTTLVQSTAIPNYTGDFMIGADNTIYNKYFKGLLDNIRISKGVARYTTTFNPPADFVQTGSKRKKASSWWYFF